MPWETCRQINVVSAYVNHRKDLKKVYGLDNPALQKEFPMVTNTSPIRNVCDSFQGRIKRLAPVPGTPAEVPGTPAPASPPAQMLGENRGQPHVFFHRISKAGKVMNPPMLRIFYSRFVIHV